MPNRTEFNQPVSGLVTPRFGGIATFMRLPHVPLDEAKDIDIGLVGIPWDGGTTNRPGPRHAPRQMRDQSSMVRRMHQTTRVVPYDLANVADLGDCPVNPASVDDALKRVESFYKKLVAKGIRPLSAGGDHLCSLPVLRAVGEKKPVGMIHFDAHTDLYDGYFGGFKYTHGTPFKRAIEEGVIDPKRVIQIGLRGSMYDNEDFEYGEKMGARLVRIEEAVEKGPKAIMAEARKIVGDDPVYVSFDIDMLDPVYAPGTGTPEIGGFTTREAQAMLRELRGLNIVGADVVEVSPPFDPSGMTAYAGVVMMFEILCSMAEDVAKRAEILMPQIAGSWAFWAFASAIFAALTAVFAKVGVAGINSDFATLIRTCVVIGVLVSIVAATGQFQPLGSISGKTWLFLLLSGFGTGASWLCYFRAMKLGDAARVAPIDKLSVVFVAIFGVVFLGEKLGLANWFGVMMMAAGMILIACR